MGATARRPLLDGFSWSRLAWHLLVWAAAYGLFYLAVYVSDGGRTAFAVSTIVILPAPLAVYPHFLALELLFARRRYVAYFLALAAIVALGMPVSDLCNAVFLPDEPVGTHGAFNALFFILVSSGARLHVRGLRQQHRMQEAEFERVQAELALLRSQIHPHFLFNTLNNLYALSLERSREVPEAILKLSGLMRTLLDGSREPTAPLCDEFRFIKDYVSLEKLRLDGKPEIRVELSEETNGLRIGAMLLVPFLENAFKHGPGKGRGEGFIRVEAAVHGSHLTYTVENSKGRRTTGADQANATGLANVRRRLELLYPGRYELRIRDQDDTYRIELEIDL